MVSTFTRETPIKLHFHVTSLARAANEITEATLSEPVQVGIGKQNGLLETANYSIILVMGLPGMTVG
jgi:hypothetical protein